MTVLTVCNHKGGTGKTTTTLHVAAAMGLSGYRVLVVDLDPQGFLTRMLGVGEPDEAASSLVLFDPDVRLGEVPARAMSGFDLLPSSTKLTNRMRRLNGPADVLWAKEALADVRGYDVVLIDTAAAITVFSLNALVAARHVLIPVTPEYQPVLGAEQTFQTVQLVQSKLNPDLEEPIFLFTQVDARKNSHHAYRRYLRERYGDHVMGGIIRTSTALAHMHNDGTTAFDHDPYARGARDYANATDELLGRLGLEKQEPPTTEEGIAEPDAAPNDDGAPAAGTDVIGEEDVAAEEALAARTDVTGGGEAAETDVTGEAAKTDVVGGEAAEAPEAHDGGGSGDEATAPTRAAPSQEDMAKVWKHIQHLGS